MSTNNTVPITWDNDQDNALFGSLFPGGLNSFQNTTQNSLFTSIGNNNIERRTPFSYSPLSKTGVDVRDNFFGGSKIHKYNNFEIVVDPTSGVNPPDKIKAIEHCFYNDTNGSGIYGDTKYGIEDKYIFTVKLYVSEIKQQIKDVYDDPTVIPADNEILLFLENNYGDWSSSTMYAKKGKNITQKQFEGLSKSGQNGDKLGYVHYLNQEYNIDSSELIEFLETGVIKNKLLDIISFLFEFSSLFVSNPVLLNGVAIAIEKAINFIQDECLIKDINWNPTKTKNFKPFLFSDITTALDAIDDSEINNYLKKGISELQNKIEKYDNTIENSILNVSKIPLPTFLPFVPVIKAPDTFSELLLQKYHGLRNTVYAMLIDAENLDFSNMAKEGIYCINAFLCGVWNGFVEAVCGIISLVKYLFEGAGLLADVLKNFKTRGSEILEAIDDITTKFHALDFGKIFTRLVESIKQWVNSDHSVSLVEISYFCGAFLGFVIELAVEIVGGILISGGVLSVEAVLAKIAEAFKAFASLIFGVIKLPFTIAGKTIEGFMKALHWLYEFLAKGTDEILRIIDEVFAKLKQVVDDARKLDWMSSGLFKFGNDGATFRNFLKLQQRADDGWYNILCHGDPKRVIIDGRKLKPEEFAKLLLEQGYVKGNKIRLIACETGSKPNGFAAHLARILETKVIAPSGKIRVDDLGEFVIDNKGKFVEFN